MYVSGATEAEANAIRDLSEALGLTLYIIPMHWGLIHPTPLYKLWDGYWKIPGLIPMLVRCRNEYFEISEFGGVRSIKIAEKAENVNQQVTGFLGI